MGINSTSKSLPVGATPVDQLKNGGWVPHAKWLFQCFLNWVFVAKPQSYCFYGLPHDQCAITQVNYLQKGQLCSQTALMDWSGKICPWWLLRLTLDQQAMLWLASFKVWMATSVTTVRFGTWVSHNFGPVVFAHSRLSVWQLTSYPQLPQSFAVCSLTTPVIWLYWTHSPLSSSP